MAANPSDAPRPFYSLDEYFALEHAGDARYEYWDGEIFCMSGGSLPHGRIGGNIYFTLRLKLAGGPCQPFTGDSAIKTPTLPPYRYPDASAVCGDPRVENIRGVDALLNPVLVVEVLSPTTEKRDRGEKFAAYQRIPGFKEYLLVAQARPLVTRYWLDMSGEWHSKESTGVGEVIRLDSVDCDFSLSEIYDGVTFDLP